MLDKDFEDVKSGLAIEDSLRLGLLKQILKSFLVLEDASHDRVFSQAQVWLRHLGELSGEDLLKNHRVKNFG